MTDKVDILGSHETVWGRPDTDQLASVGLDERDRTGLALEDLKAVLCGPIDNAAVAVLPSRRKLLEQRAARLGSFTTPHAGDLLHYDL